MTIHLGRSLLSASSNQPGRRRGDAPAPALRRELCRPYSVLLPAGFAVPRLLPAARCALTAPFHPYLGKPEAVCFLWHFPWGRPRRTLSGAVSPWSPDFPPRNAFRSGHPADWRVQIRPFAAPKSSWRKPAGSCALRYGKLRQIGFATV
jgi:hypothetical protein